MSSISPESLLGKMSLAVAAKDVREVLTLYQDFPPELLERLNRECLSHEQHVWLYALLAKWKRWNEKSHDDS